MAISATEIATAIEPIVLDKGYSLVEVSFGTAFQRRTLTVFIDKPTGVQVDDCQSLAREIGDFLDQMDLIPGKYVLEVSSPGAERPLKTNKDYLRFQGRYAFIRTREHNADLGGSEFYGYLRGLDGEAVLLETEQGQQLRFPSDAIAKARLAIKF